MPPEPNPFEPPQALLTPRRSPRRAAIGIAAGGLVAGLSLFEGLGELLVAIPVNRTYFPRQQRPWEYVQAWSFVGVGVIGLVGWCGAFALRRAEALRSRHDPSASRP